MEARDGRSDERRFPTPGRNAVSSQHTRLRGYRPVPRIATAVATLPGVPGTDQRRGARCRAGCVCGLAAACGVGRFAAKYSKLAVSRGVQPREKPAEQLLPTLY